MAERGVRKLCSNYLFSRHRTRSLSGDPADLHHWMGWQGAQGQNCLRSRPNHVGPPATVLERRYALRAVKQRLHQGSFREAVIAAYGGRCAVSGLPEPMLLDAAHIVEDRDERLGQPVVPNGIPFSKIHHAAFDAHLIGIDPDYRLHVSERLLGPNDGSMLEALKALNGTSIHL